jgi:myo-inositol-1-phosphate synthase
MSQKIKVAIAGVGNCASSLVQGCTYYSKANSFEIGLLHHKFGGYTIGDIEFVAAFDVDKRKIGKDLATAIKTKPNCTKTLCKVAKTGVIIKKDPVLDSVAEHMKQTFLVDEKQNECNVVAELKQSSTNILICYLPVGSAKAARFYAQAAIDAGAGFINAIPEFICSNDNWIRKFKRKELPCAGDDIKSQVGATIIHRTLARLIEDRGHIIDDTFQLNIGGNSDFQNMLDENRLSSKRKSKTQAVTSILDHKLTNIRIGPSDYIPHLKDNKICYINIKGRQFGNIPFELDLKLSVEDSPNSAGVMVDVIRAMKVALDNGESGHLEEISSLAFKSPKKQLRDNVARRLVRKKYQLG